MVSILLLFVLHPLFHFILLFLSRFALFDCAFTSNYGRAIIIHELDVVISVLTFLSHSVRNYFERVLYLVHYNSFSLSIDNQWCSTVLEES